jgi:signal transduction histidine kinase
MVAQTRQHAQVLADLHARAMAAANASRSVLLEVDTHRRQFRPTSGTGVEVVPTDAWIELPDSVALAYEIIASGHPRQVAPLATVLPDLAFRLGAPAAIIAPVAAQGHALGLLVLAIAGVVPALEWADPVSACADGFALALWRWRLEREIAAMRERLARSEALAHLVAGIGHELNNPLQGVLGHIELMRRTVRLPPGLDAELRQVYREASRAERIVRNLLLLAGSGRLVTRAVSVNVALRKALGLRAASCRRQKITVQRRLAAALPRVQGDAVLLQQAFHNILVNAEQALSGTPEARIDVRSALAHGQVEVEIRDNGPGLAAEVVPRVFDPFFTTRDTGSGLGLALTHRIVREHGGDVHVTNAPGGGALFTVSFPPSPVVK